MLHTALVLEDFAETRQWLVERLQDAFINIEVVEAATIKAALEQISKHNFDLALIDLNLPDGEGSKFIQSLCQLHPETYCVVATSYDDETHLFSALKAGAQGYLLKSQSAEAFAGSLRGILSGEPAISPYIAQKMISHFNQSPPGKEIETLSDREAEILSFTAKGLTRKEVSELLSISPHTVAAHLKSIYGKLNVSTRAEATVEALRLGLV